MEARVARAVSGRSFSRDQRRPPLELPETAQFFFRHLPRRSRGGAGLAAHVEWERKTALRNTIRDAYLRALARLPFNGPDGGAPTVPSLLPALLAGGYCFGPLPDAASNIIVNTVWMRAASPTSRFAPAAAATVVEDFADLDEIEQGSFVGLMRLLPLDDADRNYDYYYTAAVAAKHPNCEAFAAFTQSGLATSPVVADLLAGSGERILISAEDIERLSALLVPPSTPPLHACLNVPEPNFKEKHMRIKQQWSHNLADLAIRYWNRTIGVSFFLTHSLINHQCVLFLGSDYANRYCYAPNLFLPDLSYSSMLFFALAFAIMRTNT